MGLVHVPLCFQESKKKSLSLSNVAGAYFILIAGLVLSIIVGVIEFIYTKTKPEQPATMVGTDKHISQLPPRGRG